MASVGKTISSVTRPLRAAVKPQKFVAEHRLRSKPLQNDAAREGLVPIASAPPAPAVAAHGHGHDYQWGVTWPGHSLANQPNINTPEIAKAFMRWKSFSLGGVELWTEAMMTATSVVASSLPGKK
mmetsp:Transcript_37057/g.74826  ORF Transcript_37057/g.74826 Transcript_37057/m.74826 type:complete len:125 (-) Transcript_37057:78-452(-)